MLASQIPHFDGVFMHSCLMGNMESLVDLYPISDYMISCMHPLNSDGGSMVSLVKELLKGADFPTTTKAKDIKVQNVMATSTCSTIRSLGTCFLSVRN